VPDQDNGFFDFEKISNCTSYEPETCKSIIVISKGFDDLSYTNYLKPVYWDQGLVNQVLEQNRQALNLFDQAVDKNSFQIPDYTDPTKIHGDYKLYPMNPWRQISRLQAIKSISLSRQGKSDEALKEAVKLNKLGHQIIVGHNGLIGSLVGSALLRDSRIRESLGIQNPTGRNVIEHTHLLCRSSWVLINSSAQVSLRGIIQSYPSYSILCLNKPYCWQSPRLRLGEYS
jgi:hypothetical protein